MDLDIVLMLVFIAMFFIFIFSKREIYKPIGETTGICIEIKEEAVGDKNNHEQMVGVSPVYRLYIHYEWEGKEYLAKSARAYSTKPAEIGDKVQILVNGVNKQSVDIVKQKRTNN